MTGRGNTKQRRASTPSPQESIFSNFETVQLTTDERLFLHAARLGDFDLLKDILNNKPANFNVSCVDYMGRSALHLSVDSDNADVIDTLLAIVHFELIEEALLHAISKGALNLVRLIVDHPAYIEGDKECKMRGSAKRSEGLSTRTEEKHQYPPDVTPLMLAAHRNDHEMVQLFLSRGHSIDRPHAIHCQCPHCQIKQRMDSLKRSRSRLNAYRALASPSYMALACPDPITTTFELRQEMKQVAQVEKEFQNEYMGLVEQCMNFACEMMDLCRGTQEVEAVIGEENSGTRDPLSRLRLAIQYNEKKFVAHPNCQQHLTSIWYGKELSFFQSMPGLQRVALILVIMLTVPFTAIAYIVNPYTKLSAVMRCPVYKFFAHTMSHLVFLFLLAVATFGMEDPFGSPNHYSTDSSDLLLLYKQLRPAWSSSAFSYVQLLIGCWIVGLLWIECKQIYSSGARDHFQQYYNFMDFGLLALYLASYSLRFAALYRVDLADRYFNSTQRAKEALDRHNKPLLEAIINETRNEASSHAYFMVASRFQWSAHDPEIISGILFAIANVMSFARTTYVMPSHELLGPLQVALGRMIGDITRFIVLFMLVLFAFMVGMTNLYRYYGATVINSITGKAAADSFKGMSDTVHTLFFSILGFISLDKLRIDNPEPNHQGQSPTVMVDRVGVVMFAIFQILVTIVLINMLIAMMSHSFEAIQKDADVEWKFARTKLWMNYIEESSTLPVPFNMVATPKTVMYACRSLRHFFCDHCLPHDDDTRAPDAQHYDYSRRRLNIVITAALQQQTPTRLMVDARTTYSDIVQRIVRRYLFKLDRAKYEKMETIAIKEEYREEEQEDEVKDDLQSIREDEDLDSVFVPSRSQKRKSRDLKYHTPTEMMREMTRRATLRRRTSHRKTRTSNSQLDAIQRGQKVLDARLQDMQLLNRSDDVIMREDVKHVRQLMTENQKAMLSLVKAMTSMQDEMTHLGASMCGLVTESHHTRHSDNTHASERHSGLSSLPDDDVTSERSDKPVQPRRGPFTTLKASLRKKHAAADAHV